MISKGNANKTGVNYSMNSVKLAGYQLLFLTTMSRN